MAREFTLIKRTMILYKAKSFQIFVLGICAATLFLRTHVHPVSPNDGQEIAGFTFFGLLVIMVNGIAEMAMAVSQLLTVPLPLLLPLPVPLTMPLPLPLPLPLPCSYPSLAPALESAPVATLDLPLLSPLPLSLPLPATLPCPCPSLAPFPVPQCLCSQCCSGLLSSCILSCSRSQTESQLCLHSLI